MDDELLNAVFRFKHKAPSLRQDATLCTTLVEHFMAFVASLEAAEVSGHSCGRFEPLMDDRGVPASVFATHEVKVMQEVCRRLGAPEDGEHRRGDVWFDPWLPTYGCVLQRTMLNATKVKLELIFLDGWERVLHFLPSGECVHSSVPKTHRVVHFNHLDKDLVKEFKDAFHEVLHQAQQQKHKRSATTNELGHQKTPAFIEAVVRRALGEVTDDSEEKAAAPQGGTTDVGQHTGVRPRDTCWALVKSAIKLNLCCGKGLFRKSIAMFELNLLQTAADEAESVFRDDDVDVKAGCDAVDDMFYMLQVVVEAVVELLESGYDVAVLQDQCTVLRTRMDRFLDILNLQTAERYVLPSLSSLQQLEDLKCGVEIKSPQRESNSESSETKEDRQRRALVNLESCQLLDGASCSLEELLEWERSSDAPELYRCILVLRTIETFMFARSAGLVEGEANDQVADSDKRFLEQMQSLVTIYQENARKWRQLPRMTTILDVEQRSSEILVMWLAFCLVHRKCVTEVPLCAQYNIALDWKNLKVAVLSNQAAISALQRVGRYVRGWNKKTNGSSLFHLTHQGPTFEFGRKFVESSPSMQEIYKREVDTWDALVQNRWGEIEKKKEMAAHLREQILYQNQSLHSKQIDLAAEESRLLQAFPFHRQWNLRTSSTKSWLEQEVMQLSCEINQSEEALQQTIAMPAYLVRPLPSAKDEAYKILFMLAMPRNLEILGNLCLTAQRALAPTECSTEMLALPQVSSITWQKFHRTHGPSPEYYEASKAFTANPMEFRLPNNYGPWIVDQLSSLTQYASDCVWGLSLYGTALTWKDSTGVALDPFCVTSTSVVSSFIEEMPEPFSELQWINSWPHADDPEDNTRGNLVYANLNKTPEEFEKSSFIALASLRAFPNQQYRKLQCAVLDDILPWSNLGVATVVRQSLYQVGELTDEVEPRLVWKTDMLQGNKGLETFCSTLQLMADKLEHTPRRFECVPLLSELASFAAQFTDGAKPIVKLFARMARRWAKHAQQEYENELLPEVAVGFRQKECILYGYALLAYTLEPWDDDAAHDVCQLLVRFRTSFICASINEPATDAMLQVESRVAEMMSRRIADLFGYVKQHDHMNAVLTALVNPIASSNFVWEQMKESSLDGAMVQSCYEAFDGVTDTHYAVNLFTGVVLTNSNAPGGLPRDIREHERFLALFGTSNFEVVSRSGVLQTEHRYSNRWYDFDLQAGGELFVQELALGEPSSTLQLCSSSWIETFSKVFPARLRELYSHWYWVERDCVLFRPIKANSREVFHVAAFDSAGALQCYKLPFSDTKRSYEEILDYLDDYERFVQKDAALVNVVRVLSKFEDERFLHPLKSSDDILKIELPRFKMTFWLNSNMQFESVEHKGYVLAINQQFDDFLPRFRRYLILELDDKSDSSRSELRMLLPVGSVVESSEGWVDISISNKPDSLVDVACYDVHRRLKTFETETIGARLQLAAVCTLAGTNVPSKRLQMTGAEATVQILRACRSSRPFSELERDTLLTICKLSYREPAVKILAVSLLAEADRLAFLFPQMKPGITKVCSPGEQAALSGMREANIQRNPLRSQLTRFEENFIVGHMERLTRSVSFSEAISLELLPDDDDYVKTTEVKFGCLLCYEMNETDAIPPLQLKPLKSGSRDFMAKVMLGELQRSWDGHHLQPKVMLAVPTVTLIQAFKELLDDVSSRRQDMEKWLENAFLRANSTGRDGLLMLANFLPALTMSDLVRCAFDDETLHMLAPKITLESRKTFKKGVLKFMELCVLEDKAERLLWIASHRDELPDSQLIEELVNVRQWKSTEFPYWLAFEVAGRLQIRHEQFVIANHLINGPGTVCQLNMGRGKTRVILPMLFLHFTRSGSSRVVRAHFLGPLLSEASQFIHRYLSASYARLGIFEQPFHRQIDLDIRKLEVIRDTLQELKLFGGIQMVAPEHRMSLELKRLELGSDDPRSDMLDEILDNDQFVDILDECDALLHHKYHLVYAVGTPTPLQSGTERWKAAEALLRVMTNIGPDSRVAKGLKAAHVSCSSPDYAERLGAFQGTRLNTVVESTKRFRDELKKMLVLDLIDNAPFELMWLNTFDDADARTALVEAMTESSVSLEDALGDHMPRFTPYKCQLLALRGLVAFSVLEHCMEKRYRVDFGLPLPGSRAKKIAIPYTAADVPSERSEFSHPDVCIVLTLLGYYHGGLTDKEVNDAFKKLLCLDASEQSKRYGEWFATVKPDLSEGDRKALCDVDYISLADTRQFETLCRVYKFCMETINFYLNTCVFPNNTQQYPQRMSRTAWNLAAGENSIGFSGTNDNRHLLPLSVEQREPDEPLLLGANGKMFDKIIEMTQSYEVVHPSSERTPIPWQSVLLHAIDKGAQALIDTGALLAGVSNDSAADFLLQQPEFQFAGVTYFDSRKEFNCWMIAEKVRQLVMPLKKASMLERETFVIFDEARSRGSDMKLPHNASALLTLGPKLTKDKLMQGAGRMRQLGCDQKLWIASFDEVAQSILQTSDQSEVSSLATIDVLNWVVGNTKAESVRGLLEWASNGIHYRKTQLDRGAEEVDEDWSLQKLYQSKLDAKKIATIIASKADITDDLVSRICREGDKFGSYDEVCVTSHTDECERELQVEQNIVQQEEFEVAQCTPAKETLWTYTLLLGAKSVKDLDQIVSVVEMEKFIQQRVTPQEVASLAWSTASIFGTGNFISTILARDNVDCLNEFLRVVDVMLVFDNGEILLVSECEADHILKLLWSSSKRCSFRFVNLAFACKAIDRFGKMAKFRDAHLALGCRLSEILPLLSLIACHVYNGETVLTKQQEAIVEPVYRNLLRPLVQREATLSNFVKLRGNTHKWTRSFLHELCCRMDLENRQ